MEGIDNINVRNAYMVLLLIGGVIGLPVIIFTALFSKSVRRPAYLINLWITAVLYSVAYSLLLWSGERQDPDGAPSVVCQVQSAMIHGAPPMSLVAGLIVIVYLWRTFNSPEQFEVKESSKPQYNSRLPICQILILILPYFVFALFTVTAGIVGSQNLHLIDSESSDGLFCTLHMPIFAQYLIPIFCAVVLAALICIAVILGIRYLLHWRHTNKLFPFMERSLSVSIVIRVMLFNVYAIITFTSSIFLMIDNKSLWVFPFLTQAGVPLIAFLVFGTHKDMLNVWCFWRVPLADAPILPTSRFNESDFDLRRCSTSQSEVSFEEFLKHGPDIKEMKW